MFWGFDCIRIVCGYIFNNSAKFNINCNALWLGSCYWSKSYNRVNSEHKDEQIYEKTSETYTIETYI